jgi:hypothetical protein
VIRGSALPCYEPRQPLRYQEVRGTVLEMSEAAASLKKALRS